jgi:alkanesulfonate monooxygenase SsuD/methylene tetrahydromethanopterin reductase-like flavin-dependent oxidoreductase (luciferase family)
MPLKLTLRYDMRGPAIGAPLDELYEACLDQCEWADRLGFDMVYFGEHHGAEDGYCPYPVLLAGAAAARTSRITLHVSALVVTLHDPLRLAEDLALVDLMSRGRLMVTMGIGYRPHEFEMFGVDPSQRVAIMEETVDTLRKAWTGEPFQFRGRTVRVTPRPYQKDGPKLIMGGSTHASARRAARSGLDYYPGHPDFYETYKAERKALGLPEPEPMAKWGPNALYVTHDPERAWAEVGPHILYTTNSYAEWATERGSGATTYKPVQKVEDLKAFPNFQVVTPEQAIAYARTLGPDGRLSIQPLIGGLPPEIAWRSLDLFERQVMPGLRREGLI